MKRLMFLLAVLALSLTALAQEDDCTAQQDDLLRHVAGACMELARNTLCYGNIHLEAEPRAGAPPLALEAPGDVVPVADVARLRLSALDEDEWGIALMQLQANLPDTLPGQNVTVVLFGDVTLSPAPAVPDLSGVLESAADLHQTPLDTSAVIAQFAAGTTVRVNGRSRTGLWLRVHSDQGDGWLRGEQVRVDGDPAALVEAMPLEQAYTAGQAMTFSTGVGHETCGGAPADGILFQSPQGAGHVELTINGVEIRFGSTLVVQAPPGEMWIYLLEGSASVYAEGDAAVLEPGERVRVALDAQGQAFDGPGQPEPFPISAVSGLPVSLLPVDPLPDLLAAAAAAEATTTAQAAQAAESTATALANATTIASAACSVQGSSANQRGGPGTQYAVIGAVESGTRYPAVGQAQDSAGRTWWLLEGGGWVRFDVVEESGSCELLPVVAAPPRSTAAPAPNSGMSPGEANYNPNYFIVLPMDTCEPLAPIHVGERVQFVMGAARSDWTSCEAALNAGAGFAMISGNGPATNGHHYLDHCDWDAEYNHWGITTAAEVVFDQAGTYTYTATWVNATQTCTFTVLP